MRKIILAFSIILCIAILTQTVSAGEIIFSTERSVYYASPGEDAQIQIDVRNTFSEDVMGSFTYTQSDQNDPAKTRSFTDKRNIFSDLEHIRFNVKQSSGQDYLIDVSFDYFEKDDHSTAYHVKLDGIQVHFRDDASTLRRDTDSIPLTSVQIKMTTPEERQPEFQHDNTEIRQNPDSVQDIRYTEDNTELLSGYLEEQMPELREKRERLKTEVQAARIYHKMTDLFATEGYMPCDLGVTLGKGACRDEFSLNLVNNGSPDIMASGEIRAGSVPYIIAESRAEIPLGEALTRNVSYQSFSSQLKDENFRVTCSGLNLTPEETSVNIIYEKGITKKEINATIRDNRVISIDLIESDSGVHYIIPILIIAITLISAIIFYTGYRKYADHFRADSDTDIPETEEYTETPSALLTESHTDYINNELKEAFSKAGQAARLHISQKYRDNENLTNSQALSILMERDDPDYEEYAEVITACDRVVYAGNAMDAEKYINTYNLLKKIFEKKR